MDGVRVTRADEQSSRRTNDADPDIVLRALADPTRRYILKLVQTSELAAGRIATQFEMTQQAVSQHLRVLAGAGLLHERRHGTRRLYSLRAEALEPARAVLVDLWPDALARLKQVVEQAKRQKGSTRSWTPLRRSRQRSASPPLRTRSFRTSWRAPDQAGWISPLAALVPAAARSA